MAPESEAKRPFASTPEKAAAFTRRAAVGINSHSRGVTESGVRATQYLVKGNLVASKTAACGEPKIGLSVWQQNQLAEARYKLTERAQSVYQDFALARWTG